MPAIGVSNIPTFTPPTDAQVGPLTDYFGNVPADADPLALRMAAHMRPGPRGRNVFLFNDGSVSEVQPPNWDGSISNRSFNERSAQPYAWSWTYAGGVNPPDGVTSFTNPPSQQVLRVYWGGHVNQVTAADKTVLMAAGYPASCFGP